jgi:hypothetical protein
MLDKVAKRAETVDELILRELRELRALVERRLGEPSNDDAMTVGAVAVLVRKTPQCVRGEAVLRLDPRRTSLALARRTKRAVVNIQ